MATKPNKISAKPQTQANNQETAPMPKTSPVTAAVETATESKPGYSFDIELPLSPTNLPTDWQPITLDKTAVVLVATNDPKKPERIRPVIGQCECYIPFPDPNVGEVELRSDLPKDMESTDPRAWRYVSHPLRAMLETTVNHLIGLLAGGSVTGNKDAKGDFIVFPDKDSAVAAVHYTPPEFPTDWAALWDQLTGSSTRLTPAALFKSFKAGWGAIWTASGMDPKTGKLPSAHLTCARLAVQELLDGLKSAPPTAKQMARFLALPMFPQPENIKFKSPLETVIAKTQEYLVSDIESEGEIIACPWLQFAEVMGATGEPGATALADDMRQAYSLYLAEQSAEEVTPSEDAEEMDM